MYNRELLMCLPTYFKIAYAINPWMDPSHQPDQPLLEAEYAALIASHELAGRTVHFINPEPGWPDMTFTANQALVRGKRALLGNLPPQRAGETPHTRHWLEAHGYEVVDCSYLFSGQGDAVPTGTGAVLKGRGWRSDPRSDAVVREVLGYDIIPIKTVSAEWYDCDMVFGIIAPGVVAVCLEALEPDSQKLLHSRDDLELIPVSLAEARAFALNLVSDGTTVTLADGATTLKATLIERGLTVMSRSVSQLMLSGGGIRCTTLALDAK
jgi:N-dimethylarginine dimethylaminohydrolase